MRRRKDTSAAELATLAESLQAPEVDAEVDNLSFSELLQTDLRRFLAEHEAAAGFTGFAGVDTEGHKEP